MTDDDARERRRARRTPASMLVKYRPVGALQVDALRDISESGVFLSCSDPLPLGARIEVALPEGRGSTLVLAGEVVRVVWGGSDKGKPVSPGMAVTFESVSDPERKRLKRIIVDAGDA